MELTKEEVKRVKKLQQILTKLKNGEHLAKRPREIAKLGCIYTDKDLRHFSVKMLMSSNTFLGLASKRTSHMPHLASQTIQTCDTLMPCAYQVSIHPPTLMRNLFLGNATLVTLTQRCHIEMLTSKCRKSLSV